MSTPNQAGQGQGPMQTPKPGWQSTEFGVTALGAASVVLGAVPQQYVPYVTIIVGVYALARTVLKALHQLGYAGSVPDLPALPPGTTQTQTTTTIVPKQ